MTSREAARLPVEAARTTLGITIFGCQPDEAALFEELAPRFGVRPTTTTAVLTAATAPLAAGHRCVSVDHKTPIDDATLLALRRVGVEYLSTRSIGYDHIGVAYARGIDLQIGNVAYSPDSVADYTLMLILMAIRNARSTLRRTDAHDYRLPQPRGKELRDLTVGVVGTGRIGAAVIERLRGFGGRVLAYDRRPQAGADYLPLDQLLQRSDIVTLHTPLTADTHHLLDRRRIAALRDGAYVVNTGRGPLIDTAALLEALESGRLGGAALDVLEDEKGIFYADCRTESIGESLLRLHKLPNVLISPHVAYYTEHSLSDVVENTILNCLNYDKERSTWDD